MSQINFNMISSGSKGNSTIIWDDENMLIIDFGITIKRFKERVNSLKIGKRDTSLFISHEHSDHSKGIKPLARNLPVDIYARELTSNAIGIKDSFAIKDTVILGNFVISAFNVSHDAIDPVAFTVRAGNAKISIVSDLGKVSESVISNLKGSDILAMEANHDVEMLKGGRYPEMLKRRILSDKGHLSNDQTAMALQEILKPDVKLILTHLSQENNDPYIAYNSIKSHLDNRNIEYNSIECASQEAGSSHYTIEID